MALSGMHLSLFGGAAFFLARKLSTRRFADLFSLVCILFFVWFAGLSPSLLRALISSLILSLSSFLRLKRPDGLTLLSLTFLIHASLVPSHLFEIAFMLSYSSLFGILAFSPFCRRIISRRIVPPLASSFSASVGAFVSTMPVAFSVFGTLTPVGIIATVFVSPLVSAFLYVGLFGIVLSVLAPFLSIPFGVIISITYGLVRKTALFFAAFPHF
jgi:competence protein ComEC